MAKFNNRRKVIRNVKNYPSYDAGRSAVWHEAFKAKKPVGHLRKRDGSLVKVRTPLTREWKNKKGKWIVNDLVDKYRTPEKARMNFRKDFEDYIAPQYKEKGWRNYELDWLKNWIDEELYKRSRKSFKREEFKMKEIMQGKKVEL
tara:strand:+ start:2111 stop:2545 length:435 start_codon:yes stop_codon:yes gene_type:complete